MSILVEEIRTCNVCKKKDEYENMIMDIREILECSEPVSYTHLTLPTTPYV